MKTLTLYTSVFFITLFFPGVLTAQPFVGINTSTPDRNLEVYGSGNQHVRVQTLTTNGPESALELILAYPQVVARDFKIGNAGGVFRIMTNTDNFETAGDEVMRIDANGQTGIGTTVPTSRVHVDGGLEASNTGDGFMMLGTKTGANMIFDPNEIIGRNNGNSNAVTLQSHGADTHIGNGGGDTFLAHGGGEVGIGTSTPTSRLTIDDNDFQIALRNNSGTVNDWFIGASNGDWNAGDNQLLFSPSASSDASILRLQDVTENGGVVAPVMIQSSASQILLLDGNEIDGKSEPLYINHNSDEETYINPSGGRVGMGYDDPSSTLHIKTQDDEYALRLQAGAVAWDLNPVPNNDWLGFIKSGWTLAHVDGASGQWEILSDRRFKENIQLLPDVLDQVKELDVYSYSYIHDKEHQPQIGLIAQELAVQFPELVNVENDHYTVGYSKLSVIILKSLQEQQKEIDELQQELNALMTEINK